MVAHESTVWQLDFDSTGNFLVSCGDDQTWMIWAIDEFNFQHRGIISGHHSRTIYSISWSKGITYSPSGEAFGVDLIVTGGADNKIVVFEVSRNCLESESAPSIEFNVIASKAKAHDNDVNCVTFHP